MDWYITFFISLDEIHKSNYNHAHQLLGKKENYIRLSLIGCISYQTVGIGRSIDASRY